jgi:excisionase family DNA binding protein
MTRNNPLSSDKSIRFYTVDEVARLLAVAPRTIRRWIASGKLVAHKFGSAVRISDLDLKAFVAFHRDD